MTNKNTIYFIRTRDKHPVVAQIRNYLHDAFPQFKLEEIHVITLLKTKPWLIFLNIFYVWRLYGFSSFRYGKDSLYNKFFGTPFIFHAIAKLIAKTVPKYKTEFTFQDGSLINGKCQGIPHFVYTDHTVKLNAEYPRFNQKKDMLAPEWLQLERRIYSDAELVFTRSENAKRSVVEHYGIDQDRVQNIYYAPYRNEADIETGMDRQDNLILVVATQWQLKGGPDLEKAFTIVKKDFPDAMMIVAGCSPGTGIEGIEEKGKVDRKIMDQLYKTASFFCLPTQGEPFGISFIEAMRYSLPLIGTNVGAVPECIEHESNGFLVDPGDVADLANRMRLLLGNKSMRQNMGQRSLEIYKHKFSYDILVRKLKDAIESKTGS